MLTGLNKSICCGANNCGYFWQAEDDASPNEEKEVEASAATDAPATNGNAAEEADAAKPAETNGDAAGAEKGKTLKCL